MIAPISATAHDGEGGEKAASDSGPAATDIVGDNPSGRSSSGDVPKPLVKQDLWHVEDRLLRAASRKNGGFGPLCGALRDGFAIPDPTALERVKSVIKQRNPSWEDKKVKASLRGRILKYVPRVVPRPKILVERFDNVFSGFKGVRDGATGDCHIFLFFFLAAVNSSKSSQVGNDQACAIYNTRV